MDSWTMPWLYNGRALRIWLSASQKTRAKRISSRDHAPYEKTISKIALRDRENKKLYKKLYGFRLADDLSPFDLVLDTDILSQPQTKKLIGLYIGMKTKE